MKTKKKSVAQEVALRNRRFKAATAAKKRVLIAEDVIAQVKAGRFKPKSGSWVQPLDRKGYDIDMQPGLTKFDEEDSVRELFLDGSIPKCECCALGAMFMSCTLYNNKTTVEDFDEEVGWRFDDLVMEGGFKNGLTKFFSKDQLQLIESAFEGNMGAFVLDEEDEYSGTGIAPGEKTKVWMDELRDDKKRLVRIMENIIKNKGKFVP